MSNDNQAKRGRSRPFLIAFAVIFFLVLGILNWRTVAYRSLEDAIRAKGEPVTFAELDAWYVAAPDERNAAKFALLAMDQLREPPAGAPIPFVTADYKWDGHGAPLPDDAKVATAKFLASNKEALDLIAQAALLTESRYPRNGAAMFTGPFDHLRGVRALARLQHLKVTYEVDSGNMANAAGSSIQTFRLAETLKNEPILISQLVRIACHAIAVAGVDHLLNSSKPPAGDLKSLQEQILLADNANAFYRAVVGERCYTLDSNVDFNSANGALLSLFRAPTAKMLTRAVDASQLPSVERRQEFEAIEKRFVSSGKRSIPLSKGMIPLSSNPATELLVTSLVSTVQGFDRDSAKLRVAATAIAIERYRLADGKLPDSLDTLTPTFLESVPIDPFDGKPVRYIRNEVGFTIYSIGTDLKDDKGTDLQRRGNAQSGDIVLKVMR